jgi:SAM-dependent methyltransferase
VCAARRGAHVNGLDATERLLAIARQRVPDGDFRVGELQTLPYVDGAFDAIIAANGVPYAAHPVAALRELRRVCRCHGRVVIATWGVPEDPEQRAIGTAVHDVLPRPLPREARGPLGGSLSTPGALETLIAEADLTVSGGGAVECPFEYADLETAWQALAEAHTLQAALRAVDAAQLRGVVLRAIAPYQTSTGCVRIANHFRYVVATL